ncbi:porin, partial [Acinetobacter baumannii]
MGAYAQSSVTLYGVADVGIEYLSNVPSPSGGSNLVRMSSGNMSTSRWGLRGTEDLGGGLKALFELESGFTLDNAQ